ncbi:arrestin (or S-antigen) [Pochonia chlamydosporia 170]|uniref:Arrestin (Or S-antigen) n=1 Tax=Pochonia chlamydosporia 170 TaxID=1380566 RepID=A0A179FBB0_METCM|nr:arrestin (or S-antigen) [Pochonia chlamydosporia 170]OAQ62363.1 arrestin (or S-antigen) [Pochonia chlamydosporia 170]
MASFIEEYSCPDPHGLNDIRTNIEIKQHHTYKIYTPGDLISGHFTIETPFDVEVNSIDISFLGSTATRNYVQPDPIYATKPFMKLCMPINDSSFPDRHVFKTGTVYSIPFHFVVPSQLLMGSCRHGCKNSVVQERHLRLPPSMGFCPGNDQSPDEARVVYSIVVVGSKKFWEASVPIRLFQAYKTIRILPTCPEDAPLDISPANSQYVLCKTQSLWKTFFAKREGELTAVASQPNAVMLSTDGSTASTSYIRLHLTFRPVSLISPPPSIKSVSGKLISTTFFHILPLTRLPSLDTWKKNEDPPFKHTATHKLFDRQVEKLQWTTDGDGAEMEERRSSYPLDNSQTLKRPESLIHYHTSERPSQTPEPILLRTEMSIQFTIPHGNTNFFLPSFDSCLVSRAYSLRLAISLGATHTNLILKLPLQIGVEDATPRTFRVGEGVTDAELSAENQLERERDRARSLAAAGYNVLPGYSSTF